MARPSTKAWRRKQINDARLARAHRRADIIDRRRGGISRCAVIVRLIEKMCGNLGVGGELLRNRKPLARISVWLGEKSSSKMRISRRRRRARGAIFQRVAIHRREM